MKEKIAILTDSGCDLPTDIIRKYNISVLPLKVIYRDRVLSDRIDISPDEVYSKMPAEIPTTAMPDTSEIRAAFESLRSLGYTHVLAIHISSGLSGTCEAVRMVARDTNNMTIRVVDTRTLSMGTGSMVLEAAKYAAAGMPFDVIVENLFYFMSQVKIFYTLETLDYLARGGRIGRVANVIGSLLDVKPIISVDNDGKYYTYSKPRGRRNSISKLYELAEEASRARRLNLSVVHGGAREEAYRLMDRLVRLPNVNDIMMTDVSPSLGVHTGPGLIGVCYYPA